MTRLLHHARIVFALAGLTVRRAHRSRMLPLVAAMTAAVLAVLSGSAHGDGTAAGRMRLLMSYSLGVSAFLLGMAALWTACLAVSRDIAQKQIRLVCVKPVHAAHLWFGQWLGLLVVNAALLLFAGATHYGMALWNLRPSRVAPAERAAVLANVFTARRRFVPRPPQTAQQAELAYARLQAEGRLPPDASRERILQRLAASLEAEGAVVSPGARKTWLFDLPSAPRRGADVTLRLNFSPLAHSRQRVNAVCRLGDATAALPIQAYHSGFVELSWPAAALPDEGPVRVVFENGPADDSAGAVFDLQEAAVLLLPSAGAAANLLRALIVLFAHLALISALGLAAGTLFSFPVAAFAAVSVLCISAVGHYFTFASGLPDDHHHHHGPPPEPSFLETAGARIAHGMEYAVAPAMRHNPIGRYADGILIDGRSIGRALGWLLILYPGLFGMASAALLRRRELGMPVAAGDG